LRTSPASRLFAARRGWATKPLLAGGNILRVMREAERIADGV
jgi:hypothetical protein